MRTFFKWSAYLCSGLAALASGLILLRPRSPGGFSLLPSRLIAMGRSWQLARVGLIGAALGALGRAPLASALGLLSGLALRRYAQEVTQVQGNFENAFGPDWRERIPARMAPVMLPSRSGPYEDRPGPAPRVERNVVYHTLPDGRKLLCDLWQPNPAIPPSGLAILYTHGSAWTILDKDVGTRPLFTHLTRQGHVVMDIAYRLYPEVLLPEMLHDLQHAVAWMKANAPRYGADPARMVLGGGSAGAHLALLAAYAPHEPALLAPDLQSNRVDLSARGVFAFYGPADLETVYRHTHQGRLGSQPKPRPPLPSYSGQPVEHNRAWWRSEMRRARGSGSFVDLLGCAPQDCPERYALYAPIHHVHPGCPPTFLAQGDSDLFIPVSATRGLAALLNANDVPVVLLVYPRTEHAFDLVLPQISPPALASLYDLERFLALL